MRGDKENVLLERKDILSPYLLNEINEYLDFCDREKPVVKIISGEERLKSKAVEKMFEEGSIAVEGICTSTGEIDDKDLVLSDYIVIVTGAMRMAPLSLTETLKKIRALNKRAFVIIDKWEMIPRTAENIEKVRKSVSKEFPMVDIVYTCFSYLKEDENFLLFESCIKRICDRIFQLYEDTHVIQIEKLYTYYLKKLDLEYFSITNKAKNIETKLEQERNVLEGIYRARKVKFSNINAEFNTYSKNFFDRINLITADDCVGENECMEYLKIKNIALKNYVELVVKCFDGITKQVLEVYTHKVNSYREQLVNESSFFYDRLRKLEFLNDDKLQEFGQYVYSIESVDEILDSIKEIIADETKDLGKKIQILAKMIFEEESIIEKIKDKLGKLNSGKTDEIEEENKRIRKEMLIKNHIDEVIDTANLKVFSELDVFVNQMKQKVTSLSDNIVDSYYNKLEKILIELEAEVEKEYVVK